MDEAFLERIEREIMSAIITGMNKVGYMVDQKLREHVDEDVYLKGSKSTYYEPTFGLRNSITASNVHINGNNVDVEVYHDKNKMEFRPDDFVHGSRFWKNGVTDIREILPVIIDQGLSGDLFGEGMWYQEPRPYLRNTVKELKNTKEHISVLKKELKAYGFDVKSGL